MTHFRLLSLLSILISWTVFAQKAPVVYIEPYSPQIFRVFCDPAGGALRHPEANPPARIITALPSGAASCETLRDGQVDVLGKTLHIRFENGRTEVRFSARPEAYYYGGGVQNGRFSHKGKTIAIENQNSWTDGGVASPAPWFWSTEGYAMLWNTFAKGSYSFGSEEVVLQHDAPYLDLYVMTGKTPSALLQAYYQLTGNPVLLPKFGFYEGHLNAYNRDYWTEDPAGILFEDGKRYKESQTPNHGIRESLNGELPGNYQFSARAVIDRYEAADMPLGWVLPNDGYGAGYGQRSTLQGNVQNLKEFGDYARSKGVEIGLWAQSDLHPVDSIPALLQRDIDAEVGVAGVRVLKTDVAWVGWGYSFGLNGIADADSIMAGQGIRPFIITLDGWAGTQRHGGIWTGDQTGGQWEYIRFHIPTYIGSGLSGQPNVGSDMDGIFGGRNEWVNIRDFQWKAFTPMELNMDGWGANEKYPQALGSRAAQINRRYLKLKSKLMPYTYTIAHEAVNGLPMLRAMFLHGANPYTLGTATQYQFLYGPSLLVAPIYQETAPDAQGNDIRNNIYLPEGEWMDFFTDEAYAGGVVLNSFPSPIDKIPVFVRRGAIIPLTASHNNPSQQDLSTRIYAVYPCGNSSFTEYDDDGRSLAYKEGAFATTTLSSIQRGGKVTVTVHPVKGSFEGMVSQRATRLQIHSAAKAKLVKATVNGKKVKASASWDKGILSVEIPALDVRTSTIQVIVKGFKAAKAAKAYSGKGSGASTEPTVTATAGSICFSWPEASARGRQILFDGMLYTGIRTASYTFEGLEPDREYSFELQDWGCRQRQLTVRTLTDPYENAIKDIQGSCSAPSQPGQEIDRLFDGSTDSEMWHTRWDLAALPFDITANLGAIYTLDKLEYVPRSDAGNGTIYMGTLSTSLDGKSWTEPVAFQWERDPRSKFMNLGGVQAQFVKLHVTAGIGRFGSGRELYIYKVPGTGSYRHGVFNEKGEAVESL